MTLGLKLSVLFINTFLKIVTTPGLVTDADGRPIEGAQISVYGINRNVTSTNRGEYWRLLLPGNYIISAGAWG